MELIPNLCAMGAYISSVSRDLYMRRSSRNDDSVRMLCRRSASLMTMTRMSLLMATSILRMVAACSSVSEPTSMRVILVTPSTSWRTSSPNSSCTTFSRDIGVLDRVVQERGAHRLGVHAKVGQYYANLDGVHDEGFARLAQLPLVGRGGELVGLPQKRQLGFVHVARGQLAKLLERLVRLLEAGVGEPGYAVHAGRTAPEQVGLPDERVVFPGVVVHDS